LSEVSVLFNEPKLLKCGSLDSRRRDVQRFSALQRAEIAEISSSSRNASSLDGFSALQRAEIAEILKTTATWRN